jgi:Nucleotidyl transferase AbiEii toxin, Type IV TA system
MKDHLATLVQSAGTREQGLHIAREYLQARILASLQRRGAMIPLAFHGGTCLRFLHGIPRYSEDLDFTLERKNRGYDLRTYLKRMESELQDEGYVTLIKISDKRNVQGGLLRFAKLLQELDLAPGSRRNLAIKIEVDTNPPAGAVLETTVVRRYLPLQIQHHDKASLLAGKLHAILQRAYIKGRDYFDLFWYLSDPDWPAPNLVLLNNALEQSGWSEARLTTRTWRKQLRETLEGVDFEQVIADVGPFLEQDVEALAFTKQNLLRVCAGR